MVPNLKPLASSYLLKERLSPVSITSQCRLTEVLLPCCRLVCSRFQNREVKTLGRPGFGFIPHQRGSLRLMVLRAIKKASSSWNAIGRPRAGWRTPERKVILVYLYPWEDHQEWRGDLCLHAYESGVASAHRRIAESQTRSSTREAKL